MAITDFSARPPRRQPSFCRNGIFEAFTSKCAEWKWKNLPGKLRSGSTAMDGEPLTVAASNDCREAICTNLPCNSQGGAAFL